jgi:hypothetical protein
VCVGPSATGNGSGADWNNLKAWSSTPARGETWYLVDGTYPGRTFDTAESGSTLIAIKKATVEDHGTIATGWTDAIGDGQATFTGTIWFGSSNWVFDGNRGAGTDGTSYGFYAPLTLPASYTVNTELVTVIVGNAWVHSSSNTQNISNVTLSHIYSVSPTADVTRVFFQLGPINQVSNITMSHCLSDHFQAFVLGTERSGGPNFGNLTDITIDHNIVLDNFGTPSNHGSLIDADYGGLERLIVRYNVFRGPTSGMTAIVEANNSNIGDAEIYGNVFDTVTGGNDIVGNGSQGSWLFNSKIYNNTFIACAGGPWVSSAAFGESAGPGGNVAENNLVYNMSAGHGQGTTYDYNAYFSTTNTPSEPNAQVAAKNPFKDYGTGDYTLSANTNPGTNLGAPYSVDALGHTRATWTRGALEFVP